ncbi:hypothetical protein ACB092_04G084000 [Castanea dentata]
MGEWISNGVNVQVWKDKWLPSSSTYKVVSQSPYKLAMESSVEFVDASSSNDSNLHCFWKKLWWLPTPHKVRHFLWRACHDILSTKECILEPETSGHLFWSCPRAKREWSCSGIFTLDGAGQFNSFMELAWKIIMVDHCDDYAVALMGTIAWRLWGNRNETHNGGKRLGELELCPTAAAVSLLTKPVVQQYWLPPSNQLYKVNVDGAVFKARKESRVSVIIRDANGLVVATLSKKFHAPLGPLEESILEGDSLNVVRALQGLSSPSASIMYIIYRIQSSCHDAKKVLFSYVCRQGNKPAHLLAKHAIMNPYFLE